MNIAIKSPKWNQQKYNLSLWQTANITSVARNFRSNKDFQSQVKWQRSFFLSRQRTSNLDERFVSDALLTAPSFVSLQCTWQRSLTRWSSVTLKSQPTGFITTLIIVALMHSASITSHLWKGRAHSRTSWIKTQPNQRQVDSHIPLPRMISLCHLAVKFSPAAWHFITVYLTVPHVRYRGFKLLLNLPESFLEYCIAEQDFQTKSVIAHP